jgi:hypothetical protein
MAIISNSSIYPALERGPGESLPPSNNLGNLPSSSLSSHLPNPSTLRETTTKAKQSRIKHPEEGSSNFYSANTRLALNETMNNTLSKVKDLNKGKLFLFKRDNGLPENVFAEALRSQKISVLHFMIISNSTNSPDSTTINKDNMDSFPVDKEIRTRIKNVLKSYNETDDRECKMTSRDREYLISITEDRNWIKTETANRFNDMFPEGNKPFLLEHIFKKAIQDPVISEVPSLKPKKRKRTQSNKSEDSLSLKLPKINDVDKTQSNNNSSLTNENFYARTFRLKFDNEMANRLKEFNKCNLYAISKFSIKHGIELQSDIYTALSHKTISIFLLRIVNALSKKGNVFQVDKERIEKNVKENISLFPIDKELKDELEKFKFNFQFNKKMKRQFKGFASKTYIRGYKLYDFHNYCIESFGTSPFNIRRVLDNAMNEHISFLEGYRKDVDSLDYNRVHQQSEPNCNQFQQNYNQSIAIDYNDLPSVEEGRSILEPQSNEAIPIDAQNTQTEVSNKDSLPSTAFPLDRTNEDPLDEWFPTDIYKQSDDEPFETYTGTESAGMEFDYFDWDNL